MKRYLLSQTLGNIPCEYLRITSENESINKLAIVFTARVHPGETVGSLMMKGALEYLCSENSQAKLLRELFVFYMIPMLNPDGVIVGNYRSALDGIDLNRNFRNPSKVLHPQIFLLKKLAT